ncbi:MAG: hypothetical protein EZS28_020590 [Streblomastix strix]|uniref:Uncharacterized protein n=1 Tax=Streblomastix strix TaxID=222440 RepID=A0A5J4VN22_9EUKA|nr:MAG: hypothetical protein EZS28_020590 [Streblomastix strix]
MNEQKTDSITVDIEKEQDEIEAIAIDKEEEDDETDAIATDNQKEEDETGASNNNKDEFDDVETTAMNKDIVRDGKAVKRKRGRLRKCQGGEKIGAGRKRTRISSSYSEIEFAKEEKWQEDLIKEQGQVWNENFDDDEEEGNEDYGG